jgi:sigma-B regulation protein RsbU (phosphoserine phosphatase)
MEVLIRQHFRRAAKEARLEFLFAADGADALRKLHLDGGVDVVLTDLNMPEMDGLTLLREVGQRYPLLKSVVVSAYGDMPNIRRALNRGAFDFLTKPIDFQDLGITIDKAVKAARHAKGAEKDRTDLVVVQRELEIAREIQTSMLPAMPALRDHDDFEIAAKMLPAREIGGDFYDFFLIDDHHVGFVIGDVSGKGIPAAFFMAQCRTLLKITALKGMAPHHCLLELNGALHSDDASGMFVTMLYGILDTRSGVVDYSNAGHTLPYVLRGESDATVENTNPTEGTILGAVANLAFDSAQVRLDAGDTILLHTDGVTEARDAKGQFFGKNRLEATLQSEQGPSLDAFVDTLVSEVVTFSQNAAHADDITVLALKYHGK